jgi:anti-sigma factor RsiW
MSQLTCQELVELVTRYLEGTLERRTRRRFEAHIAECDGCEIYLEQIRATVTLLGSLRASPLPPETHTALLQLFRGWAATPA